MDEEGKHKLNNVGKLSQTVVADYLPRCVYLLEGICQDRSQGLIVLQTLNDLTFFFDSNRCRLEKLEDYILDHFFISLERISTLNKLEARLLIWYWRRSPSGLTATTWDRCSILNVVLIYSYPLISDCIFWYRLSCLSTDQVISRFLFIGLKLLFCKKVICGLMSIDKNLQVSVTRDHGHCLADLICV